MSNVATPRPSSSAGGIGAPSTDPARSSWIGQRFASIGGMRPELMDEFPGERRQYIAMAMALFCVALEAFLSGAFAVNLAFTSQDGKSPEPAVLVVSGLVWAFIIFSIDRFMVLGMEGTHGPSAIIPALIRCLLAIIIGAVMSTPLVLQLFDSDIRAQIAIINDGTQKKGQEERLKPLTEDREKAQKEVDARQQALQVARSGTNVEKNPVYIDAMKAWTAATKACTAAQTNATLEFRGKLPPPEGSGRPGGGSIYRNLQNQANVRCSFAAGKKTDLSRAKKAATLTPEQVQANIKRAEEDLAAAQTAFDQASKALLDATTQLERAAQGYGLLTRLLALHEITKNPGSLGGLIHFAIFALFAIVEIAPVLFKVFLQMKPGTSKYEDDWRSRDNDAFERGRLIADRALAAARLAANAPVDAAQAHQAQQSQVNAHMAREIAEVQLAVMQRALHQWAAQHGVGYQPARFTPASQAPEDSTGGIRPGGHEGGPDGPRGPFGPDGGGPGGPAGPFGLGTPEPFGTYRPGDPDGSAEPFHESATAARRGGFNGFEGHHADPAVRVDHWFPRPAPATGPAPPARAEPPAPTDRTPTSWQDRVTPAPPVHQHDLRPVPHPQSPVDNGYPVEAAPPTAWPERAPNAWDVSNGIVHGDAPLIGGANPEGVTGHE